MNELRANSPDFARIWSSQRIRVASVAATELLHPLVGRLTVTQRALSGIAPADTYILVTTTESGSSSEKQLRRLSELHVPASEGDSRSPDDPLI